MDSNAINAMLAHQMSMGDDNIFVRSKIESYTFLTFGTVSKYEKGRVDVICGKVTFTGVEVMVFGVNGWGIKPVPAEGDRVLLLTSQAPVPDLKEFEAPGSMPAYDVSGMKAIPITDDEAATQLITVSADGIEITGDNKLTVNADGVSFEDANKNKVTTSKDGVAFEDKYENKITTGESGMTLEDKKGNKIVGTSSGMTLQDANGCKVEMTSNGTIINGNLKIKVGS